MNQSKAAPAMDVKYNKVVTMTLKKYLYNWTALFIHFFLLEIHGSAPQLHKVLKPKETRQQAGVVSPNQSHSSEIDLVDAAALLKSNQKNCAMNLHCLNEIRQVKAQLWDQAFSIINDVLANRDDAIKEMHNYNCTSPTLFEMPNEEDLTKRAQCLAKVVISKIFKNAREKKDTITAHDILQKEINRYIIPIKSHQHTNISFCPSGNQVVQKAGRFTYIDVVEDDSDTCQCQNCT